MNDEKWYQLVESIREKFGIDKEEKKDIIIEVGREKIKRGIKEVIEFRGASGKMKLERHIKPVVLEKKFKYHRKKVDAQEEYIFSKNEFSYHVEAYIWDEIEGDWKKFNFQELL